MAWTVGELKERLDDWGDHVPVVIELVDRGFEIVRDDFDVDDRTIDGEIKVVIEP